MDDSLQFTLLTRALPVSGSGLIPGLAQTFPFRSSVAGDRMTVDA
jgi:hypothetical protein